MNELQREVLLMQEDKEIKQENFFLRLVGGQFEFFLWLLDGQFE